MFSRHSCSKGNEPLIYVKGAQVDRTEPPAMGLGTDWIAVACYASLIVAAMVIVVLVVLAF